MARGGPRAGAGRKRTLSFLAKVSIGSHCEALWRDEWEKKRNAALDAKYKTTAVEWRKAMTARERGEPLPYYHEEDVQFALQTDHQRAEWRMPAKRPKGKTQRIVEQVAAIESAKRGFKISTRMVETCWDLFRATEKKQITNAP